MRGAGFSKPVPAAQLAQHSRTSGAGSNAAVSTGSALRTWSSTLQLASQASCTDLAVIPSAHRSSVHVQAVCTNPACTACTPPGLWATDKDLYCFSESCTKFTDSCSARQNTYEFFLHEYVVNFVHGREKPYRSLSTKIYIFMQCAPKSYGGFSV